MFWIFSTIQPAKSMWYVDKKNYICHVFFIKKKNLKKRVIYAWVKNVFFPKK